MQTGKKAPRIDELFARMPQLQASDLHLKEGNPPLYRIDGELRRTKARPLRRGEVEALVADWLGEEALEKLQERGNLDIAHEFDGGRVRVSIFLQKGRVSLAARLVKHVIPTLEELHLPKVLERITTFREGLVLVCGVTGAGKSTTLAALLEIMNQKYARHVLTFEDPIEYVYTDRKCVINQREFGVDFFSWPDAIRAGVRADPDVMLIGEMRDQETFQLGLTASETGHLVLGTMHTAGASTTLGRILDLFPPDRHKLIRQSLAFSLRAILSQRLVPSFREEIGRVPAVELLWVNAPIRKAIEEGEDAKLPDLIEQGEAEGMISWTRSFVNLLKADLIERRVARQYAPNRDALEMALKGITFRPSSSS